MQSIATTRSRKKIPGVSSRGLPNSDVQTVQAILTPYPQVQRRGREDYPYQEIFGRETTLVVRVDFMLVGIQVGIYPAVRRLIR